MAGSACLAAVEAYRRAAFTDSGPSEALIRADLNDSYRPKAVIALEQKIHQARYAVLA